MKSNHEYVVKGAICSEAEFNRFLNAWCRSKSINHVSKIAEVVEDKKLHTYKITLYFNHDSQATVTQEFKRGMLRHWKDHFKTIE